MQRVKTYSQVKKIYKFEQVIKTIIWGIVERIGSTTIDHAPIVDGVFDSTNGQHSLM